METAEAAAARVLAPVRIVVGVAPAQVAAAGDGDGGGERFESGQVPSLAPDLLRSVLLALIEEGRRFSGTPEGRQMAENLIGTRLHSDGKVLWTMGAVDEFLEDPDAVREAPALGRSLLEAIRRGSIEDYLMHFLEEYADKLFGGAPREGAAASSR